MVVRQTGEFVPHVRREAPIQLLGIDAKSNNFSREIGKADF